MDWKVFLRTVGKFYSIGYGIVFLLPILVAFLGVKTDHCWDMGYGDIIFGLWAIGTALWKAGKE